MERDPLFWRVKASLNGRTLNENGFHFDLPAGLTEDELLGWVEGTLARDEALRVASLLGEQPVLQRMAMGMRSDRLALASLPDERPPSDLIERVEATMERQALLGLADDALEAGVGPMPVVRPIRVGAGWGGGVLGMSPTTLRLGMAAGVLLACGIGAYFAMNALRVNDGSDGPIWADATPAEEPPTVPPVVEEMAPFPEMSSALASAKTWSPAPLEYSEAPPTLSSGMSIDRALALAEVGRLVVRVRSDSPLRSAERLGGMVESRRLNSDWRVAGLAEGPMADLFGTDVVDPIALAGSEDGPERLDIEAPTYANVFIAEARLTAESLRSLLDGLAQRGQSPSFEEIAEPAPQIDDGTLELRDIVWWSTGNPSDWGPWIKVPVVVERKQR